MSKHRVVTREQWLAEREALLRWEKAFTRERDALTEARQALPWVEIDKQYVFDTTEGKRTLAELFDGSRQLVVYHFMYDDGWDGGCASCTFWAEQFERNAIHLLHRDTRIVLVSRARLETLQAYRERMGWTLPWVSSHDSDFNRDFHVSFTDSELENETAYYNYRETGFPSTEAPGLSVFYRDDDGQVFHTYSCYERGLDIYNTAYHIMDSTPLGRNETEGSMAWLRRRDEYDP